MYDLKLDILSTFSHKCWNSSKRKQREPGPEHSCLVTVKMAQDSQILYIMLMLQREEKVSED